MTPSEPVAPEAIRLDDGPAGIVQLDGLTGVRVNLSSGRGAAEDKIRVLSEAGVRVVESPGQIGATVVEVLVEGGGMAERTEIRLAGTADQNLALAGVILAEAAAIYENKYATQSQSYGPEARSGASKADVIISAEMIESPRAMNVNFLLALTDDACRRYVDELSEGGTLLLDSDLVKEAPPERPIRVYRLPLLRLARDKAGRESLLSIVALGAIAALAEVVSYDALEQAVLARIPKGMEEETRRALQVGLEEAQRAVEKKP